MALAIGIGVATGAGAALVAAQKFYSRYKEEMEELNIKGRLGVIRYMDHRRTIIRAMDKMKLSTNHINFGIAGHVKTGKSSMINALRGLDADDPNAAPVGIDETTQQPSRYNFCSSMPNVKLYDFPGAGTISHPPRNYFFKNGLCMLDVLIILLQPAICKEDIKLARKALKYHVPVIFIRSKMDEMFDNYCTDHKIDLKDDNMVRHFLKEIRHKHIDYLKEHAPDLLEVRLFHVSSRTICEISKYANSTANNPSENEPELLKNLYIFEEKLLFEELIRVSSERFPCASTSDLSNLESKVGNSKFYEAIEHLTFKRSQNTEESQKKDSNLCCICLKVQCEVAFKPCCHFVTCQACSNQVKTCPICRAPIVDKMRIYQG